MTARDRLVVAIVAVVAATAAAWFLVIQPKRDQASKLGAQVTAAQQQLDSARATVASAQSARSSFAANYSAVARLGEAVPTDDNVPSLIVQLQNAASRARVDFRALQLVPGAGGVAAPAATATGKTTPGAAATQAVTATLPPGAAVGPAGFPTMPFTFTFRGNFFHLADFFAELQRFVSASNKHVSVSGRLMTLNAISLGPAQQGFPQITALISATTYLLPQSQGLTNGATPAGPAGAGQPVSNSTSPVPATTATVTP
jgi:type II secretory pathway pseudopilin PulG